MAAKESTITVYNRLDPASGLRAYLVPVVGAQSYGAPVAHLEGPQYINIGSTTDSIAMQILAVPTLPDVGTRVALTCGAYWVKSRGAYDLVMDACGSYSLQPHRTPEFQI